MGQQRKDSFQVKAHPVFGAGKKAKDPIFGLAMGGGSQTSDDNFRWFCIESGSVDNPPIVLIHGFPSQVSLMFFFDLLKYARNFFIFVLLLNSEIISLAFANISELYLFLSNTLSDYIVTYGITHQLAVLSRCT
ncbi:uncharacterized protein LOC114276720 isoform X4 [Camellia sinensis]|uniref:uncharacterized protein LOC114276720 isoform X4 n=1 Tax=Camellia sinensis TaxID=4442 RepID=UPI0010359D5F|nr:uncharacterized protein LOC114276720 isoform X4 [Camellia sinensis]